MEGIKRRHRKQRRQGWRRLKRNKRTGREEKWKGQRDGGGIQGREGRGGGVEKQEAKGNKNRN